MVDRVRILEGALGRSLREFPVTTVLGLRQVGKTTLARRAGAERTYVTFDDLGALAAARRDPQGFLAGLPRPVTVDEVQRVPELLLAIKREVDRRPRAGQFLLTGSAQVETRRSVSDTLAGRASMLRLRPMTWSEAAGRPAWNAVEALFSCRSASEAAVRFARSRPLDASRTLAGGIPLPMLRRKGTARGRWFDQYRSSYIERDVPPLVRIEEVATFVRYLTLAAIRTGQVTHHSALAQESGVSGDTGLRWFGVLQATFLADLVSPYWRNLGKRLVKSPKVHFGDAGLAAHLAGLRSWSEAVRLGMAGALLETLVAQHLLVFLSAGRRPAQLFHYRTHAGAEVDFVVERDRSLLPIEVKLSSTVGSGDLRGLRSFLSDFGRAARFGVILYGGTEAVPLGRGIVALPLAAFLEGPA